MVTLVISPNFNMLVSSLIQQNPAGSFNFIGSVTYPMFHEASCPSVGWLLGPSVGWSVIIS